MHRYLALLKKLAFCCVHQSNFLWKWLTNYDWIFIVFCCNFNETANLCFVSLMDVHKWYAHRWMMWSMYFKFNDPDYMSVTSWIFIARTSTIDFCAIKKILSGCWWWWWENARNNFKNSACILSFVLLWCCILYLSWMASFLRSGGER